MGTGIWFPAINVLGLLTYLFSITFYPHLKKNENHEKMKNVVLDPFLLFDIVLLTVEQFSYKIRTFFS